MSEETLFELPAIEENRAPAPTSPGEARVLRPVRNQPEWAVLDLESRLPQEHRARVIWSFLERLDLSAFYAPVKAVENRPGRPTTDPKALLALWLLATVDGIGSARRLARLCQEHDAYRWMRGNVPINYHMLSDFRVAHQEALDGLLTQIIGSLMAAGAVRLERVAQDGMRVRASAGAASFRGAQGLKKCMEEARAQVERLAQERERPDPGVTRRERAARERVAREREKRVEEALSYLPRAQAKKERQLHTKATDQRPKVTKARVSTTDPQATVMKMPDGGFRPACNVGHRQRQWDGVGVTSSGTAWRSNWSGGRAAESYLMDGGFATRDCSGATRSERVCGSGCPGTSPNGSVTIPATGTGRMWQVASTDGHRRGQSRQGRVDERPGSSSRSEPIQRTGACQNRQRHAPCRRGPQPPALGGVDGLSGHRGQAPGS